MIADTERLIDGFRGLPAGMDGSKDPPLTPNEAAWYATNVTFRGGNGPRTRPGFHQIPVVYWRDPKPQRINDSLVGDGTLATVTTSVAHEYTTGDQVTIAGADTEFNGTYKITVTGADTFTFESTEAATASAAGTSLRDVDNSYAEDLDSSGTSRSRFSALIASGIYLQGVQPYQDPREGNPTQIVVVIDGWIVALDFAERSCKRLNSQDRMDETLPVYMVQAEKYIVIQNGKEEPRVFDGFAVYRASQFGREVIPIGKQMVYGQGRLFVAVNDGTEIVAGDIVFGGSTTSVGITVSSAANPTVITTADAHGLSQNDLVTIQGHSSTPWINSTYAVGSAPSTTTFTIPVAVTSSGRGGFVVRFNAGQESDCLRFTETRFLNEGGNLAVSSKFGKIVALSFLPVQDTATGQGDLIAFCEQGAVTFQVSAPRDQWKSIQGFQRVLFDNIGSANENVLSVNGDIFFRSVQGNGIRTYRNARAEINSYGQTSVSAEINPVLAQDTDWMLRDVSFAVFDNRLLMTCWPKLYPRRAGGATYAEMEERAAEFAEEPVPIIYSGLTVMDFDSVSTGRGKSAAVFDGVWTGIQVVKLAQASFEGNQRCFAFCLHENSGIRSHEIWEVTKDEEYDLHQTAGVRMINSAVVTKAFSFQDPVGLKKIIRCDLWFDGVGGGPDNKFSCELAYRPDDYPNFTRWGVLEKEVRTEFLLEDKNLLSESEAVNAAAWTKTAISVVADNEINPITAKNDADRIVEDTSSGAHFLEATSPTLNSGEDYTFSVFVKAQTRNRLYLKMTGGGAFSADKAAWFHLSGPAGSATDAGSGVTAKIDALDDDWYRCSISALTDTSGSCECVIGLATVAGQTDYQGDGASGLYVWGAQLEEGGLATSYDAEPPQLLNFDRGYFPQIKFPTPPRAVNLSTEAPAYLGHDFTLRVAWTGRARLGRLMLHGQRLVEKTGGGI